MSKNLRLDLIVRRYPLNDRTKWPEGAYGEMWTWRLWSGSRIVSSSGSQRYSRRIDCARGAEVGAGVFDLVASKCMSAFRWTFSQQWQEIEVRILDEREVTA